jgi:hypothetical protein
VDWTEPQGGLGGTWQRNISILSAFESSQACCDLVVWCQGYATSGITFRSGASMGLSTVDCSRPLTASSLSGCSTPRGRHCHLATGVVCRLSSIVDSRRESTSSHPAESCHPADPLPTAGRGAVPSQLCCQMQLSSSETHFFFRPRILSDLPANQHPSKARPLHTHHHLLHPAVASARSSTKTTRHW